MKFFDVIPHKVRGGSPRGIIKWLFVLLIVFTLVHLQSIQVFADTTTATPEMTATPVGTVDPSTPTDTPLPVLPTDTSTPAPTDVSSTPTDSATLTTGTPASGLESMGANLLAATTGTLYVSTSGSDSNPGTLASPFRTIGYGISRLPGGGTLYIRGGNYNEFIDKGVASGTASMPTTIMAYPGETVVVDGGGTLPTYQKALWSINSGEYIIVSNIELKNSSYDGFLVFSNHVTLNNVNSHDHKMNGIGLRGSYDTADGCRVSNAGLANSAGTVGSYPEGIYSVGSNNVIRNSTVTKTYGEGINVHNSNTVTVEGCVSYDNWATQIYVSDSTNVTVRGNFFYATGAMNAVNRNMQYGIEMGDENYTPASSNIKFINNIVYGNKGNLYWWKGSLGGGMNTVLFANNTFVNSTANFNVKFSDGNHTNVRLINNIFEQDDTLTIFSLTSNAGFTFSHNLWSKAPVATANGTGDVIGNPMLAKAGSAYASGWFKLTGSSPAINKGISLTEVTDDYAGVTRGNPPEIGAFEYSGGIAPTATPLPTTAPTATKTSTPLPTAAYTNTPLPTVTKTPLPTATKTALPTNTATSLPTATSTKTPLPTATNTALPTNTATPLPTATNTPLPTSTSTSAPTLPSTQTPAPTAIGTVTNTPIPSQPPSAPVLISPAAGSLTTTYTPNLDWSNSTTAAGIVFDHYHVQLSSDSTFSTLVIDQDVNGPATNSLYAVTTPLNANTTYYWRVDAYNTLAQASAWSAISSFRTVLGQPMLAFPVNGFVLQNNTPLFDWGDVSGASSYRMQVSKKADFTQIIINVTTTTSAYQVPTSLPSNLTLYWRVQALGTNGPSAWSATQSFVTAKPPSSSVHIKPAMNALVTTASPNLTWSASAVPLDTTFDHYQVQLATDPAFTTIVTDTSVNGPVTNSSFTPPGSLNVNARYYWRVRAFNSLGQSSTWSNPTYFRVAMLPPQLNKPIQDEQLLNNRPIFTWQSVEGATSYRIQISRNSLFTSLVANLVVKTNSYPIPNDLPANAPIFWRVQVLGVNGPSLWSEVRSIKSANPPAIPYLLSPAQNILTYNYSPTLDWQDVFVPVGTTFDHYGVQVASDPSFSSLLVNTNISGPANNSSFVFPSALAPNSILYWRVNAVNSLGQYSSWSTTRIFRTAILTPSMELPSEGNILSTLKPVFDWSDITGATGYKIQVSRNSTFTALITNTNTAASNYSYPYYLPYSTMFYWRVQALGINGPSKWSTIQTFKSPPPP